MSFHRNKIRQRVQETYEPIISQVKQNVDRYVWNNFHDPEQLGYARLAAMEKFLLDYEIGRIKGRYLWQSLPKLELADHQFELCVCSHLLFLYSDHLSLDFHIASIHELLRISKEVRIFPLLKLDCEPSPYLELVVNLLSSQQLHVEVQPVAYEFQKGGNQMLKINR
jgi:hypothetical protein